MRHVSRTHQVDCDRLTQLVADILTAGPFARDRRLHHLHLSVSESHNTHAQSHLIVAPSVSSSCKTVYDLELTDHHLRHHSAQKHCLMSSTSTKCSYTKWIWTGYFGRIHLHTAISIRCVNTTQQVADISTKGSRTIYTRFFLLHPFSFDIT